MSRLTGWQVPSLLSSTNLRLGGLTIHFLAALRAAAGDADGELVGTFNDRFAIAITEALAQPGKLVVARARGVAEKNIMRGMSFGRFSLPTLLLGRLWKRKSGWKGTKIQAKTLINATVSLYWCMCVCDGVCDGVCVCVCVCVGVFV